jgi:hypothetical protein
MEKRNTPERRAKREDKEREIQKKFLKSLQDKKDLEKREEIYEATGLGRAIIEGNEEPLTIDETEEHVENLVKPEEPQEEKSEKPEKEDIQKQLSNKNTEIVHTKEDIK